LVQAALAHDGPALVDCDVNPNEPPMPGVVSTEQAKGFAEAFVHGQPHKSEIAKSLMADTIEKLKS
jgi:pyruvate dehydrogenase (quinone)